MAAEIVPFPQWRPCGCQRCQAVERNWHHFGAKRPLADFLAEHSLRGRDPPSVALALIADKGRAPLARAQARTVLEMIRFERVADTPDDAA